MSFFSIKLFCKKILMLCWLAMSIGLVVTVSANEPLPMTQVELKQLLSDNSIEGQWAGRDYRQYFEADGDTLYQEHGRPITRGEWWIDKQGQYCSIWPPSRNVACYRVLRDDKTLHWPQDDGQVYLSKIISGRALY